MTIKPGDLVTFTGPDGQKYTGEIIEVDDKTVRILTRFVGKLGSLVTVKRQNLTPERNDQK